MVITLVRRYERSIVLLGLTGIIAFVAFDIASDLKEGLGLEHIIHEILILGFCLLLIVFQLGVITRQRRRLAVKAREIEALTESREEFRRRSQRFSLEFSEAVSQQFLQWGLSEGESDVAILLIKGLSMKEIAESRNSKETTVRQQAASIYRKAKLEGRQELSSYFLEDLFNPPEN